MNSLDDDLFIVIPSWEKLQHYKDRDAPWIKNYTRLLSHHHYLTLTSHQRGVLHGVWLAYASGNRHLTANTRSLSRRLNVRVTSRDLAALNHAGFIQLVASTHKEEAASATRESIPLASRASPPSQEAETEAYRARAVKEKPLIKTPTPPHPPSAGARANGAGPADREANVEPLGLAVYDQLPDARKEQPGWVGLGNRYGVKTKNKENGDA